MLPTTVLVDFIGGCLFGAIVAFGAGQSTAVPVSAKRVVFVFNAVPSFIGESL
jgi:hypothetical protein